ncbi:hypothetical protein [Streptomyces angustmyceticus]|uniref:hypothetical protein n=1 Tax=Streptomyces angustmyceticus TaxID=285578 RepID=UPI003813BADC
MRKIMAIALAAVACSATLTITSASTAAAAERAPHCVVVRKYFNKGQQRYVRLTNLCSRRTACFTIIVPHQRNPHGSLPKGATKDVRYGTTRTSRALFVKNSSC